MDCDVVYFNSDGNSDDVRNVTTLRRRLLARSRIAYPEYVS